MSDTKPRLMDTHYSSSCLTGRNWTKTMINKFLGEPHEITEFKLYGNYVTGKFWLKETVEQVEQTDAFKSAMEARNKRKQSANKAVKTKTDNLIAMAESLTIHYKFPKDYNKIVNRAVESYNNWYFGRSSYSEPTVADHQRLAVNFLRHECTSYDCDLELIFGKVGTSDAYRIIKNRILDKIADEFPNLKEECNRQKC